MAFVIDWEVGLFFLALLPIFSIILFFIIKNRSSLPKVQEKLDQLNEHVSQNLSGVRVIRAFAQTKRNREVR